jgi:hypothetical protein
MDPFSAIGLAGNIITFLDFGYKVVSAARYIHSSPAGLAEENESLEFLSKKMEYVATSLRPKASRRGVTADEIQLEELAGECHRLSHRLLELLNWLKATKPNSKRASIRAAWRNMRHRDEKLDLEKSLDQCRQQLHLHLTLAARYVCSTPGALETLH